MTTRNASNRLDVITTGDNGALVTYGPGGTDKLVATVVMEFAPSLVPLFAGSLQVLGKICGPAGDTAPFLPIRYRKINVAGTSGDRTLVDDPITSAGIIEIPCNGLIVALLVTCTAGQCQVYTMDVQGPSTM